MISRPRARTRASAFRANDCATSTRSSPARSTTTACPAPSSRVAHPGKLVYFKAFGFAGKAKNVPMATDTILELASMTKPMAAIRALALTEQGRLPL